MPAAEPRFPGPAQTPRAAAGSGGALSQRRWGHLQLDPPSTGARGPVMGTGGLGWFGWLVRAVACAATVPR